MKFRKRRELTEFDGVLETDQGPHDVAVRDVTNKGLRLRGLNVLLRNPKAVLVVKNKRLRGIIRWGKDAEVGFELERPLTPQLQSMLLRRTQLPGSKRRQMIR